VSAAIEALFKLNVNCETVFSCLDEKDVQLMGYWPSFMLITLYHLLFLYVTYTINVREFDEPIQHQNIQP